MNGRKASRLGRPKLPPKKLYNVRLDSKLTAQIKKFCAERCWSQATFAEKAFRKFIVEN